MTTDKTTTGKPTNEGLQMELKDAILNIENHNRIKREELGLKPAIYLESGELTVVKIKQPVNIVMKNTVNGDRYLVDLENKNEKGEEQVLFMSITLAEQVFKLLDKEIFEMSIYAKDEKNYRTFSVKEVK